MYTLEQEKFEQDVQRRENSLVNSIFHTREFLEIFRRARNVEPSAFVVKKGTGAAAGFNAFVVHSLPVLPESWQGRCTIYSPAWTCSADTLCDVYDEILPQLSEVMKRNSLFIEWRMSEKSDAVERVFAQHGWTYVPYLNYLIRLDRGVEPLWMSFDKNTRNSIRRAKSRGLQVKTIQPGEEEVSYGLIRSLYEGKRIPLFDKSVFLDAFRILGPTGMLRGTLAVLNGKPVATRLALLFKDVVFDWYAASDRSAGNFSPNETLAWEMMEFGALNGFRVFDFGGAGRKGEDYGPGKFKEKFRGELVEHGRFMKACRPRLYRVVEFLYQQRMKVTTSKR